MDTINNIVNFINDNILWGIPMIVAILATGVFMTIRTKFLQVRKFKESMSSTFIPTIKSLGKNKTDKSAKTISPFEAFSAAISGTVGTGNIVGVATALISGGPGAIFWMWISAFFGLVTNYSENVLGLYYRKKDKNGEMCGGPMYYISNGLNLKSLALVFAICCSLAAVGMGMVQSNSISGIIQGAVTNGNTSLTAAIITGACIVVLASIIIVGGIKRIGKVASYLVPFMALLFIIMALIIIFINITAVPKAFELIFTNAFSFRSVSGGFLGYVMMKGMRFGFARGIFSNEAGLGSSVIAHSASATKEPVKQGLWGIVEVFIDTFVICTLTAISLLTVCIISGAYDLTDIAGNTSLSGSVLAPFAFTYTFGTFGQIIFTIILPLFAFTTILAWAYYGEKAIQYLFGKHGDIASFIFKILYVGLLFLGAMVKNDFVWALDDTFNALMALPNLVALIFLSKQVVAVTKNYFDRKKGLTVTPMLSAYNDLNAEFISEETESKNA